MLGKERGDAMVALFDLLRLAVGAGPGGTLVSLGGITQSWLRLT